MERTSFLTFSVGGEQFCICVQDVQEIIAVQEFQPVPCAPRCIKGIAGVRGKMITLIEVSEIFGIKEEPVIPFSAMILTAPYEGIGLSVYSHIDMRSSSLPPDPNTEEDPARLSTIDIDGVKMVYLNAREIFSFCEQKILNLFKVGNKEIPHGRAGDLP